VSVTDDLEHWRSLLSRSFVPLEPAPVGSGRVGGRLRSTQLGSLYLAEVRGSAQIVKRTAATIRAADPALVKVGLQLSGRGLLEQDGRETVLSPGDFALYETTRPYRLRFDGPFRMLVVMCPRTDLAVPAARLSGRTATPVRGASGIGAAVSPFLRGLRPMLDTGAPTGVGGHRLGTAVLESLGAAFDDSPPVHAGSTGSLFLRATAHLELHLGDPELGAESVAGALHVSVRYLQRAFENEGETVGGRLRRTRLERCRRDLRDPALAERSVGAIAARWGLVNPSHFSRAFRAAYGLTPREYREAALCGPAQESCARGKDGGGVRAVSSPHDDDPRDP